MNTDFKKFDSMNLQSLEYQLYSEFVNVMAEEKSRNEYFTYLLQHNAVLYAAWVSSSSFLPREATEAQRLKLMVILLHLHNKPQS